MNPKLMMCAAFAAAVSVGAAAAHADNAYELRIRGYVPVICRASVDASVVSSDDSVVSLGALNEFCNNASGYEVWVDYSPELANATLWIDGRAVSLTSAGSARISRSNHPAVETRTMTLELAGGEAVNGSLSVRVVPL